MSGGFGGHSEVWVISNFPFANLPHVMTNDEALKLGSTPHTKLKPSSTLGIRPIGFSKHLGTTDTPNRALTIFVANSLRFIGLVD
jgi:hypothetical protein